MRPAYITATRSQIRETMPRLWVMKIMARPCVSWSSLRRARYWAGMVRSRLVVGSARLQERGRRWCARVGGQGGRGAGGDRERHGVDRFDGPPPGDDVRAEVSNFDDRA